MPASAIDMNEFVPRYGISHHVRGFLYVADLLFLDPVQILEHDFQQPGIRL